MEQYFSNYLTDKSQNFRKKTVDITVGNGEKESKKLETFRKLLRQISQLEQAEP